MFIDIDSIWKASDGRLLRVVTNVGGRIGVRNLTTNRLSYIQRRYFENQKADGGWRLERYSAPLIESAPAVGAVDTSATDPGTPSTRASDSNHPTSPRDEQDV